MNDKIFFKNISYNYRSNKIHLWWNINGKDRYDKFDYTHDYYEPAKPSDLANPNAIIKKDIYGKDMVKRVVNKAKDVSKNRKDLAENDLKPEVKFLHKYFNGIKLEPDITKLQVMYYDIEVAIEDEFPDPEEAKYPINAIAQYFSIENKLIVYGDKDFWYEKEDGTKGSIDELKDRLYDETGVRLSDIELIVCDEKTMITKFIHNMHKYNTDVFSGWNSDAFDNIYVYNRIKHLDLNVDFSIGNKTIARERNGSTNLTFSGITSIDYLLMYRDKYTFDNKTWYSLDNIARIETNKSKLEYDGSIKDFYKNDWNKFMLYNMIDTLLVKAIDQKKNFMNLALISANNNRIPLSDVLSTIAGHTGNIIELLHDRNMVLNDRDKDQRNNGFPGGISWNNPGFYKYCVSFDIASMYPHLIVRDNLGPETVEKHRDDSKLKDIIRIDDMKRKRSFFFEPNHIIDISRLINGKETLLKVKAKDIEENDLIILYPDREGWQGAPKWNYNMGKEISWFPEDK